MALLLKRLDIHGFKSFGTPTSFEFGTGITAIIGPNGSGKSNIAEALRWVLGEQGYSNLRSRRTEDVIFSGSDKRAPLGMAEVTLTLENSNGELPVPFSEVQITRRAFRSGESAYLINGGKVRLKDIQQLVAPLGQSYTIIGQGLVDTALSQRPEERRGLFEHAAGISGLRMRANDALRGLNESAGNAQRLRDILSELEPRVRSLERSARLAREYGTVRDELYTLQIQHYRHAWQEMQQRQTQTDTVASEAERSHTAAHAEHSLASRTLGELRHAQEERAAAYEQARDALNARERELRDAEHGQSLLTARIDSNSTRIADVMVRRDELTEEAALAARAVAEAQALDSELSQRQLALDQEIQTLEQQQSTARERHATLSATRQELTDRLLERSRVAAQLDGSSAALTARSSRLETELDGLNARIAELEQQQQPVQDQVATVEQQVEADRQALDKARSELDSIADELRAIEPLISAATSRARDQEREIATLQARHDALDRSHLMGEGLYAGVRAIVRAVNSRELTLPGLRGTLAELVEVPANLDTAIEVALGPHLQDLVVNRWADAELGLEFLRTRNAGRATFQPLDSLRPGRSVPALNRQPGVLGIAADLVGRPDDIDVLIRQLLGRTLVVTDLEAARRILSSDSGWTTVTLDGDITRPSGSVTGGGRVQDSGLLRRERERRALPETIAQQRSAFETTSAEAERLVGEQQRLQQVRTSTAEAAQLAGAALANARAAVVQARDAEQRLERDVEALRQQLGVLTSERTTLAAELDTRLDDHQQLRTEIAALEQERAAVERDLAVSLPESDANLAIRRSELSHLAERIAETRLAHSAAQRRHQIALEQAEARSVEIESLNTTIAADRTQATQATTQIATLREQVANDRAQLSPAQEERQATLAALRSAEVTLEQASAKLREAERERDRAQLQVARVQDERVFLVERMRGDLEVADPGQLPTDQPLPDEPPDEHEMRRLRERLRRMSNVGEDILEQHETESNRFAYLTQQLTDVDQASAGLQEVLDELQQSMTTRFAATFKDVAIAFEDTFKRLFGGGQAKLVLQTDDDGGAGVDIVAQPPGKRLQSLSALSGGERALTAVALLMAIQQVNPSPFCLLDEVDAALDESNVVRFRDELKTLANTTQYIVVTHNRGTIMGADILYGVTMGDDGITRILSLRLDEALQAVDEFENAEPVAAGSV